MASPRRIRRTLAAREARMKEIDKEVEKILNERSKGPVGLNSQSEARPIGIQSSSPR